RFTCRPGTSEIWAADVGASTWEEIDRVKGAKTRPAQNFGWPCYEGAPQRSALSGLDMCKSLYADTVAPALPPYFAYNHASTLSANDTCPTQAGSSAISAISFNAPNSNYPTAYKSALFFGDYVRDCIWVMFAGANGLPDVSTVR